MNKSTVMNQLMNTRIQLRIIAQDYEGYKHCYLATRLNQVIGELADIATELSQ